MSEANTNIQVDKSRGASSHDGGALPEPYYQDAFVTLFHADCRDVLKQIARTLTPDCVLVTDPPYGIDYNSGHAGTLPRSIKGDKDASLRDALLEWWDNKPALVFGTWRVERPAKVRQLLVWDTGGALGMGALDLPWKPSHQEIYVMGHGFRGVRSSDVIRCAPVQSMAVNGRVHPHEKPVSLLLELIAKCPAGVVLDPFAGSGSTLRAGKDLGRTCIGIEIEERYCEVAAKRLAQEVFDFEASRSATLQTGGKHNGAEATPALNNE